MTDLTAPPNPDEEILIQFIENLDKAADPAAVLETFCRRFPHMTVRLREQAALLKALDQAGGDFPARLGDFRIVRRLQDGGMGVVLEAVQEPLGRRVAVKVIRPDRVSGQLQARFRREQKVLAALHQTNIVPIHAAGQEGDLLYFAMPFLRGATLEDVIQSLSTQAPAETDVRTPTLADLAQKLSSGAPRPADPATGAAAPTPRVGDATAASADKSAPDRTAAAPVSRTLSAEYFQSVARFMAEAAQALQHAHDLQILHRDIKPSNLMVDHAGNCWIIDFGLAAYIEGKPSGGPAGESLHLEDNIATGLAAPGTPPYMAPEQWRNEKLDARTDVWGLGATLYELLTLERAFPGGGDELRRAVLDREPAPPRTRVRNVPRDLAAICKKALHKDPRQRYQSPSAFADDLNHWLRAEPLADAGAARRLRLWTRRNRGWSAAIGLGLAASIAFAIGLGKYEERSQEAHRQFLMQQMQLERKKQFAGWSANSWDLVRQAAAIRKDDALRTQAAAALVGVDSKVYQVFKTFDASAVLFDPAGKRLLIGGAVAWRDRPASAARSWDAATGEMVVSQIIGPGPVAFAADGSALHLVVDPDDRLALTLWNLDRQKPAGKFKIPGEDEAVRVSPSNRPVLALSADGKLLAASARLRDGTVTLAIWDTATGKILRQAPKIAAAVSAIAIDSQAGLAATGDEDGQITLWPLGAGAPIVMPRAGRTAVQCLAFRKSLERRPAAKGDAAWLLASGDAGGSVVIWDLGERIPKTHCHGSHHGVYCLAFSPDGATLASGGRSYNGKLWDIATGRTILNVNFTGDFHTGLAFSPDGKKLAASRKSVFGPSADGGVIVFELLHDRGVQSLHGLTGQASKVRFSPGGKYVAALSDTWQVGIWDLKTGFLLHQLDVPRGFETSDAALAFSPDVQRFAFATGVAAQLWDLGGRRLAETWKLPPGLQDTLAFDAAGKRLMLCRMETDDGKERPFGGADPKLHPRVVRVRDLLGPEAARKELAKIPLKDRLIEINAVADAGHFVVVTQIKDQEGFTQVFAGFSDKELWSLAAQPSCVLDPLGTVLATPIGEARWNILEMPSGKLRETWNKTRADCLSPGARYWGGETESNYGFYLSRGGNAATWVTLGIDSFAITHGTFSDDGRLLAWGNSDGTICVCDVRAVQHKLAEVGLGWE
jgi:serine/threonine protein kinase/WD40 repeat protein